MNRCTLKSRYVNSKAALQFTKCVCVWPRPVIHPLQTAVFLCLRDRTLFRIRRWDLSDKLHESTWHLETIWRRCWNDTFYFPLTWVPLGWTVRKHSATAGKAGDLFCPEQRGHWLALRTKAESSGTARSCREGLTCGKWLSTFLQIQLNISNTKPAWSDHSPGYRRNRNFLPSRPGGSQERGSRGEDI